MEKYIKCPHCGEHIEEGMSVCRGCHAEVINGPTRSEAGGCGCLIAILTFMIAVSVLKPATESEDYVYFLICMSAPVGYGVGGLLISKLVYRGKRIIRSYKHK